MIPENEAGSIAAVRARIAQACAACGRDPDTVRLVAVSKTVGPAVIRAFHRAGQVIFGENRAQDLRDKARALADLPDLRWHFIGTIQTNKVKYLYPIAELVHSVDRPEVVEAMAEFGRKTGRLCPFLLEFHISDEPSKHGFAPEEAEAVIRGVAARSDVRAVGLMGMAPFVADPGPVRAAFARLRAVFEASRAWEGPGYRATELSMGMSDDFPLAIEAGATLVRIGRAVFEPVVGAGVPPDPRAPEGG